LISTLRRLFYIAFFLETGLLLVVLPWSEFWSRNYFVMHWPAISPWVVNDFVRGGVSGLGLINLVAGIADMIPLVRREPVRRSPEGEGG